MAADNVPRDKQEKTSTIPFVSTICCNKCPIRRGFLGPYRKDFFTIPLAALTNGKRGMPNVEPSERSSDQRRGAGRRDPHQRASTTQRRQGASTHPRPCSASDAPHAVERATGLLSPDPPTHAAPIPGAASRADPAAVESGTASGRDT